MINDLRPYPEYKDSGLPWLGQIPAHWDTLRAKYIFREVDERSVAGEETHLSMSQKFGLVESAKIDQWSLHSESYAGGKLCKAGDLVLNRLKAHLGIFAHAPIFGVVSPDYSVFRMIHDGTVRYFEFLFKTPACTAEIRRATKGIVEGFWRLYTDDFYNFRVPCPSLQEQEAITTWIDRLDRLVRRFIRNKRRIIELLNEQKQAIIDRAITRGLNPGVRLKPSGIDWLGDVPEHWDIRRVKQTTRILRGKFTHRPRNDPSLYDGPYPFIQTGAVARATKFINGYKQTLNEKGLAVSKLFPSGTLVMTIAANIGDVAILNFDACFPDSIVGFVPSMRAARDYLYLVFKCMKPELLREAPVNTQGNLNVERIGAMGIPLPPLEEQKQIARSIEIETQTFSTAIARPEREIALLREYRTRLTADVVTGKLDVRHVAPGVVESYSDELESLDDEMMDDDIPEADDLEAVEEAVHAN